MKFRIDASCWFGFARSAMSCSPRRPFTRCANAFLTRTSPTSSNRRPRRSSRGNPHLDEVIVAPRAPACAGLLGDLALGRRLRRAALRPRDRFPRRPARVAAHVAELARRERIGYDGRRARLDVHAPGARGRASSAPRHSVENQWDLLGALGVPRADRDRVPGRDAGRSHCRRASVAARLARRRRAGLGDRLIVIHVSAGNPFRRWPADAFARARRRSGEARSRLAAWSSRRARRNATRPTASIASARAMLRHDGRATAAC